MTRHSEKGLKRVAGRSASSSAIFLTVGVLANMIRCARGGIDAS
jgi:hypothetical protein